MKKKIFLIALALSVSGSFLAKPALAEGGFRYWNYENASWDIAKHFRGDFEQEMRFDANGKGFYYEHSDVGFVYKFTKWFEMGPYYRFIMEKRNQHWMYENRPHVDATLKETFFGWGLSTRSRFEYRNREAMKADWQYRNKFGIKAPFKWTRFEIQPYVNEEIFVDINAELLNRNWLSGGLGFKLSKHWRGEIFCLWEEEKSKNEWVSHNVLGSRIKLSF